MIRILFEDKSRFIKRLDFEGTEVTQDEVLDFFRTHANLESKIPNWQASSDVIVPLIIELMKSTEAKAEAKKKKSQRYKDIQSSSKDVVKVYETDRFAYFSPLNHRGAAYCDSAEIGGGGAKWCIGYEKSDEYWKRYVYQKKTGFVMAVDKKPIDEDTKNHAKVMYEIPGINVFNGSVDDYNYIMNMWNQPDTDIVRFNFQGNISKIDSTWNRHEEEPDDVRGTTREEEEWIADALDDFLSHSKDIMVKVKETFDGVFANEIKEKEDILNNSVRIAQQVLGSAFIPLEERDEQIFFRQFANMNQQKNRVVEYFITKWFRANKGSIGIEDAIVQFLKNNGSLAETGFDDGQGNPVYYFNSLHKTFVAHIDWDAVQDEWADGVCKLLDYPPELHQVFKEGIGDIMMEVISAGRIGSTTNYLRYNSPRLPSGIAIFDLDDMSFLEALKITLRDEDSIDPTLNVRTANMTTYLRSVRLEWIDGDIRCSAYGRPDLDLGDPRELIRHYYDNWTMEQLEPILQYTDGRWEKLVADDDHERFDDEKLQYWGISSVDQPSDWFIKAKVGPFGNR